MTSHCSKKIVKIKPPFHGEISNFLFSMTEPDHLGFWQPTDLSTKIPRHRLQRWRRGGRGGDRHWRQSPLNPRHRISNHWFPSKRSTTRQLRFKIKTGLFFRSFSGTIDFLIFRKPEFWPKFAEFWKKNLSFDQSFAFAKR